MNPKDEGQSNVDDCSVSHSDHHPSEDFVLLGPQLPNGGQAAIRHHADHSLELTELHFVKDGVPLMEGAELVNLTGDGPAKKVESIYKNGVSHKGPAKVTTKEYRNNYDSIFGSKKGSELN